jgi:hypothetical protein
MLACKEQKLLNLDVDTLYIFIGKKYLRAYMSPCFNAPHIFATPNSLFCGLDSIH